MRHSSFSTEVKNTLQLMRKNTQRLLLLVNNLMDVQKYDSQKMVLQKEKFDLSVFVQELYELFVPVAKNRNITFTRKNELPIIVFIMIVKKLKKCCLTYFQTPLSSPRKREQLKLYCLYFQAKMT